MLPYQFIEGGSFTSDSTLVKQLQLSAAPDYFFVRNRTNYGDTTAVSPIEAWYFNGMSIGTAYGNAQTVTTNALSTVAITTNGFTFVNTANPPTFAALAATAITGNAGTFVVSMANTGSIAVGDYVRLYATTGELQIAGYVFQVTAVTTNTSITLGYMASSGITFAADATAGQVLKLIPNLMYPKALRIANITQAAQAVVYFTQKNPYTPGERLAFRVPSQFGMTQMNYVEARVLSVTNSATVSSVTLDWDTSGYTAFTFPTSAQAAAGVSPAIAVPSASAVVPLNGSATNPQQPPGTNLLDAFDNQNLYYMQIGSNIIKASSKVFDWFSFKYDQFTSS